MPDGRPAIPVAAQPASVTFDSAAGRIDCRGDWTVAEVADLQRRLPRLQPPGERSWELNTDGVRTMDTAGAYLLHRLLKQWTGGGRRVDRKNIRNEHGDILELVESAAAVSPPHRPQPLSPIARLGERTVKTLLDGFDFLAFIGETAVDAAPRFLHPHRLRWRQIVRDLQQAGLEALPIVGLLAFLMGVVIAYQGGGQLQAYGANVFLVDLLAMTMLREMAPLVTAIIVAGRTGSAYAAQIGTMKLTEELDALRTLGIGPFEILVLPKLLALLVALPLLTVFADLLGLLGGLVVADSLFGIDAGTFIRRVPEAITGSSYWVGIAKAPVFAAIIALIGCFNGFRVRGSAEDVGAATTRSVVQAIFLVIVADAFFSIVFNALDL